ncbi:MAG: hypothetical protein ACYDCH_10875 [Gaiellaceae bacterium]
MIGFRESAYYWIPLTPALAIGMAAGIHALGTVALISRRVALLIAGVAVTGSAAYLIGVPRGHVPDATQNPASPRVARFVRSITRQSDRIYIVSPDLQEVYWLADRRPAAKYLYPDFVPLLPDREHDYRRFQKAPAVIVVAWPGLFGWPHKYVQIDQMTPWIRFVENAIAGEHMRIVADFSTCCWRFGGDYSVRVYARPGIGIEPR